MQQPDCPMFVGQAATARKTKEDLPATGVMELYETVMKINRIKLETED